jgi:hypothetical protein
LASPKTLGHSAKNEVGGDDDPLADNALGAGQPDTLISINNLAALYQAQGGALARPKEVTVRNTAVSPSR